MIKLVVLCLSVALGATVVISTTTAFAQEPQCRYYRVNTSLLNISREPRTNSQFIDVIEDGDIACATREQRVDNRVWIYVAYKLKGRERKTVEGWSVLRHLIELSAAESAALKGGAAPPAAKAPPPAGQAAIRPEDVLRFEQPIPFGPVPVNGSTIKQLAEGTPLFPPIEGLDEAVWKKPCTSCHKWNRQTLCTQGTTYAKDPRAVLRHPHPYGGGYKIALLQWAKGGCQ